MGLALSVVVPVYEQWHLVPRLLDALTAQSLAAQDFEVILVDNMSADFAPPAALPANTRVIRCAEPGSYAARNAGAAEAVGRYLAFTDADCVPESTWLEDLLDWLEARPGPAIAAGTVDMVPAGDEPNAVEIYQMVKGVPQRRYVGRGYGVTANLAIARGAFAELGGFDPQRFSGGDAEFCRRAGARGIPIGFVPGAVVAHPCRESWAEVATRARRIKGGQLTSGSRPRRLLWVLRTLTPPLRAIWLFSTDSRHPVRHRAIAVGIQLRLWLLEIGESARLWLGRAPERR